MIPEPQTSSHPYVLILGGTSFMGKALLEHLGSLPYRICCINRGKVYWNDEAKSNTRIEWFCADRRDHKDYSATVSFASRHLGISQVNKWAAVVDFCAFKWRDLQSSLSALKNIAHKYIFISSDSVYNNFIYHSKAPISQDTFNLEQEYERLKQNKSKDLDEYGYVLMDIRQNKMKCQLYLRKKNTIPFVSLRLPDVVGPFDNTNRFWITISWMEWSDKYPLCVSPNDETSPLSMVDSGDVARCIVKLIGMEQIPSTAYNICCNETPSLVEFLQVIKQHANLHQINLKSIKGKSSNQLYPSVECGPLNCQKAKNEICWAPTALSQTVRQTVEFFKKVAPSYAAERSQMDREFRKKVIDKSS